MAYIQINSITLTPTPPGVISVTVAYKIGSNPDIPSSYTLHGVFPVNPDGTFVGGALFINGLTEGINYTVHIYAECFGTKVNFLPIPGANGTSTTTTTIPPATVNWSFTKSGKATDEYYYIYVQNSTGSYVPVEVTGNTDNSGTFFAEGNLFISVTNGGSTLLPLVPNYYRTRIVNETDGIVIFDLTLSTDFNTYKDLLLPGKTYSVLIVTDVVETAPTTTTTTSTTTTAFCAQITDIFINASSS